MHLPSHSSVPTLLPELLISKDKKKDKEKKEELTADGPYVLYQPDGQTRVINVDKKGNIIDTTYTTLPQNLTLHVTDHKGRFPFDVKLHPVKRPG